MSCIVIIFISYSSMYAQSKVTALCNEKSDWLEQNADSPLAKIVEHRRDFEERIQPHMAKLMPLTE